jgi:hypothetical protein
MSKSPIAWPVILPPKPRASRKKPGKAGATYLELPESAMYGYAKDVALSLHAPLGWGYCSTVSILSSQYSKAGVSNNPHEKNNLYCALLGPAGVGKSQTIRRVIDTLKPSPDRIEMDTPASDRGFYTIFKEPKDAPPDPRARAVVLILDELRDMMSKIAVQGSTLGSVLCKLFNMDHAGSAVAAGHNHVHVDLSILGGLKTADIEDFQSIFGSATTDGLWSRFIFAPPPKHAHPWDFNWVPTMPPPSNLYTVTRILPENRSAFRAWESDFQSHGFDPIRLAEIGLRVAVTTAAANGETEISDACLAAALEFISWLAVVKFGYQPGIAMNDEAALSAAILRALRDEGNEADGTPRRVKFNHLVHKRNWVRKYNGTAVVRVKKSLEATGSILIEYRNEGTPEYPVMKETGWVRLTPEDVEEA